MNSQKSLNIAIAGTLIFSSVLCLMSIIFSTNSLSVANKAIKETEESSYYVDKKIQYLTANVVSNNREIERIKKAESDILEIKKSISLIKSCECDKPKAASEPVKEEPKVEAQAVITIYTLDGCAPCSRWLATEKKKLEDAGWDVVEAQASGPAPSFLIELNGKSHCHEGYLSMGSLKYIIENYLK